MDYHVRHARYIRDYVIEFSFSDGSKREIDFEPHLWGPVFEPLKDKEFFQKFRIRFGSITWPNGADVAPETLHSGVWPERAEKSASTKLAG